MIEYLSVKFRKMTKISGKKHFYTKPLFLLCIFSAVTFNMFSFNYNSGYVFLKKVEFNRNQNPLEQTKIIGKVTDKSTGEVLAGANVAIKGTDIGTTTKADGYYELIISDLKTKEIEIEVSYIGYNSVSKTVEPGTLEAITLNFELTANAQNIGDIIVTANKKEQTIMNTPLSVQSLSERQLNDIGAHDIADLMSYIPGASENASFNLGQKKLQLRGIPAIVGDLTVGYYFDEAAFNYYGAPFAPLGRAFDMERIEVLRGPQSTLYGGGAMGGVIKFIPNKPYLHKFEGKAAIGTNMVKDGDIGYSGDLALNIPLIKEKLAIRLVGSYEEIGGYIETADGTKENIDKANLSNYRAALLYQPIKDLKINLIYQGNIVEQNGGAILNQLDPPTTNAFADDKSNNKQNWYIGSLLYNIADIATLTTTTNYLEIDDISNQTYDIQGMGILTVDFDNPGKALNHETRLVSNNSSSPLEWMTGFFYTYSEKENKGVWNVDALSSSSNQASKAYSFFGEISYGFLNNQLKALVGLRSYNDNRNYNNMDGSPILDEEFTSINPRFNLSFHPNKESNYYINVAKGFRSGLFNNPAYLSVHTSQGLPGKIAIDSDILWSYEIGTKLQFAEKTLMLELAAYYQNWKNMQNTIPDPTAGIFQSYQVGDVEIPGIDFSLAFSPSAVEGFNLQVVANINDAKYKKINPELIDLLNAKDGDRIQSVPEWNIGVVTNYQLALGNSGWFGNTLVALTHADKQIGFGVGGVGEPQTLLRLKLEVQNDKFSFSVFGNNLLDESDALYKQSTAALTAYNRQRPRAIGIEIKAKF